MVFNITPLLTREPNHNLGVADIEAWEKIHGRVPRGAFAAEKCLLKQGHWQSEVMANLDQVKIVERIIFYQIMILLINQSLERNQI